MVRVFFIKPIAERRKVNQIQITFHTYVKSAEFNILLPGK